MAPISSRSSSTVMGVPDVKRMAGRADKRQAKGPFTFGLSDLRQGGERVARRRVGSCTPGGRARPRVGLQKATSGLWSGEQQIDRRTHGACSHSTKASSAVLSKVSLSSRLKIATRAAFDVTRPTMREPAPFLPREMGNRRREWNNVDATGERDAATFEISCVG
jgi:hypothetical protein